MAQNFGHECRLVLAFYLDSDTGLYKKLSGRLFTDLEKLAMTANPAIDRYRLKKTDFVGTIVDRHGSTFGRNATLAKKVRNQ